MPVLIAAILKALYEVYGMLQFELSGFVTGDALIYITMGRGILNGLTPYVDLFESKPPGLFYLFALSLWMGGTWLVRLLEIISLLLIPLSTSIFFLKKEKTVLLTAFLFGILLMLRTQENGAGLQSEIFGLIFADLYVLTLFVERKWIIVIRGILVAGAVGIREPYLLGIAAAALLCKDFVRTFIVPSLIAAGIGIVFILLAGLPYIQVYLPEMFLGKVEGVQVPFVLRMVWVRRTFESLTSFSSLPLLGYAITFMFLRKHPLMLILGVVAIHEIFILGSMLHVVPGLFGNSQFLLLLGVHGVGFMIYGFFFRKRHIPYLLALIAITTAASLGGFTWNYMLYMVPFIITLSILFFRKYNVIPVALLLAAGIFLYESGDRYSQSFPLESVRHLSIDQRYVYRGAFPILAFSKHSPIGPIFTPQFHPYLEADHPLRLQTLENSKQANILVGDEPFGEFQTEIGEIGGLKIFGR